MRLTRRLRYPASSRAYGGAGASHDRLADVSHFSESVFTVQGHGVHTAVSELIAAQRASGLSVRLNTVRWHGTLHLHTLGPTSLLRSAMHRGRTCATAHITVASLLGSIRGAELLRPLITRYMRYFYNRMALVIAPTNASVAELRDIGVMAPIQVIPNGIDRAAFSTGSVPRSATRRRLGAGDADFVVISVGQLQPRKGVEDFVACARALPAVRFVWIGDFLFGAASADRRNIRRMIAEAPPNVLFTGQLRRDELPAYYQAADAFLLASRHETFGFAPLEAACAGVPLLLSDLPVFREVFGHVEGAAVYASRIEEFVYWIRKLVTRPDLRVDMGRRARTASAPYDLRDLVPRFIAAYGDLTRRLR